MVRSTDSHGQSCAAIRTECFASTGDFSALYIVDTTAVPLLLVPLVFADADRRQLFGYFVDCFVDFAHILLLALSLATIE